MQARWHGSEAAVSTGLDAAEEDDADSYGAAQGQLQEEDEASEEVEGIEQEADGGMEDEDVGMEDEAEEGEEEGGEVDGTDDELVELEEAAFDRERCAEAARAARASGLEYDRAFFGEGPCGGADAAGERERVVDAVRQAAAQALAQERGSSGGSGSTPVVRVQGSTRAGQAEGGGSGEAAVPRQAVHPAAAAMAALAQARSANGLGAAARVARRAPAMAPKAPAPGPGARGPAPGAAPVAGVQEGMEGLATGSDAGKAAEEEAALAADAATSEGSAATAGEAGTAQEADVLGSELVTVKESPEQEGAAVLSSQGHAEAGADASGSAGTAPPAGEGQDAGAAALQQAEQEREAAPEVKQEGKLAAAAAVLQVRCPAGKVLYISRNLLMLAGAAKSFHAHTGAATHAAVQAHAHQHPRCAPGDI